MMIAALYLYSTVKLSLIVQRPIPKEPMSFTSSLKFRSLNPWLLLLFILVPFQADALGQGLNGDPEETLTSSSWFVLKEGTQTGNLYVQAFIAEGYHCYSQYHKGPETKSRIDVSVSDDFTQTGKFVPDHPPHIYPKDGAEYETFEVEVVWIAPFTLAEGVNPEDLGIELVYYGQACDESGCEFPVAQQQMAAFDSYDADLVVRKPDKGFDPSSAAATPELEKKSAEIADTPEQLEKLAGLYDVNSKINYVRLDGSTGNGSFMTALIGAFLGGMLLNLMPCVFPVLGLKVMGFVEQAGNDPKKIRLHGLAFAFGLIFSMWVLAGAILVIKATGSDVAWGQQMSNSYFIGGVVILLFVLGLNLVGVFEMGLFMTRVGGGEKKEGYTGSFVSGIITTLVATPCSGPFLGAAMGYTLAQPPIVALFLFTIFGLGIAMPYLVMSFFPALIKVLPRPGEWMETFKKLMAFTLFAAAAFFAKAFAVLTGYDGMGLFLIAMCVISLGLFFYGKYSPEYVKGSKRYVWGWLAPLLICGSGLWMYTSAAKYEAPQLASKISEDGWRPWVPGRVEQQLTQKKAVWVDYTADW